MTLSMLWSATGLGWRFVAVMALTLLVAPLLQLIPFLVTELGPAEHLLTLPMILMISWLYGVAESVIALPNTIILATMAWTLVHGTFFVLKVAHPWPGRAATVAAGLGICSAQYLHWTWLGIDAAGRTFDLATGVQPASLLAGWKIFVRPAGDTSGRGEA